MKKVIAIVALIMIISSAIFATSTEVITKNVPAWATQDDSLAYSLFPQILTDTGKRAVLEYNGVSWGYGNIPVDFGVLGVAVNIPKLSGLAVGVNQYGLGLGIPMDSLSAGLLVLYGPNSSKTETLKTDNPPDEGGDITTSPGNTNIGILAGASLKGDLPLDFGVGVNLPTEVTADNVTKDQNGNKTGEYSDITTGLELGVDARAGLAGWLLNLGFSMMNSEEKELTNAWTGGTQTQQDEHIIKTNSISAGLGAANTLKPSDNVEIIPGVNFSFSNSSTEETNIDKINDSYNANKQESKTTGLSLNAFLGGKAKINETWSVLGGIQKNIWNLTTTETKQINQNGEIVGGTATKTTNVNTSAVSFNVGLQGVIGNVILDLQINPAFLTNGPYLLSGSPTAGMVAQIAITTFWE